VDTTAEDAARNEAALASAQAARDKAIAAGAETFCPDVLAILDGTLDALKTASVARPVDTSIPPKAQDLEKRYEALEKAANALTSRDTLDSLGLAQYASDDYADGEAALNTLAQANPLEDDGQTLCDTAKTAADAYARALAAGTIAARENALNAGADSRCPDELAELDTVLDTLAEAYEGNPSDSTLPAKGAALARQYQELEKTAIALALTDAAQAERREAVQAKARADDIKSAVTEKDAYAEAADSFFQGEAHLEAKEPQIAIADYRNAREIFDAVFQRASLKRQEALEAMRLAEEQTAGAEAFALEADAVETAEAGAEEE
jgi:hypothetical protein